jgi:hypothetical protein
VSRNEEVVRHLGEPELRPVTPPEIVDRVDDATDRIAALEERAEVATASSGERSVALAERLDYLEARFAALERRVAAPTETATEVGEILERLEAVDEYLATDGAANRSPDFASRLDTLETLVGELAPRTADLQPVIEPNVDDAIQGSQPLAEGVTREPRGTGPEFEDGVSREAVTGFIDATAEEFVPELSKDGYSADVVDSGATAGIDATSHGDAGPSEPAPTSSADSASGPFVVAPDAALAASAIVAENGSSGNRRFRKPRN